MADQKAMKKRLKALMNLPENQVCSDCNERQPRWASLIVPPPGAPPDSLAIGAFCCLECSGSHRRLGVHISFVRSINLDSWKEKEVLAMENGGNAKVNAIFEARLPNPAVKPTNHANGSTRERFIRDKYERRKYYDAAGFADYAAHASQRPRVPQQQSSTNSAAALGPPSDAARQRLEQRRNRISKAQSNVSEQAPSTASSRSRRSAKPAIAQAPVSAPPPTMDLLDLMGGGGGNGGGDAPAPQPAPAPAATDDLFASFVVAENTPAPAAAAAAAAPKPAAQLDILSLYHSSAPQQQPQMQQNSNNFAAFDSLGSSMGGSSGQQQQQQQPNGMGSMMPAHGSMMPQQNKMMMMNNNSNNMHQMTNMMSNMQFSPQQQQQQNRMFQQAQQGGGGGYTQQQMMMMQQQQQQMMMMQQQQRMTQQQQNGFGGGMMGAGAQPAMMQQSPQQQVKQQQEKEDPFAQFGSNVFRS